MGVCGCIPARVALALLVACGVVVIYMSRVSLSIAVVSMVRVIPSDATVTSLKQEHTPQCLTNVTSWESVLPEANDTISGEEDSRIPLTSAEKGFLLGAFFYGYFIVSPLGGRLAELYGTKKTFGVAVLLDATINFLVPVATSSHYSLLIALRVLSGLAQGVCYPSLHALLVRWIPKSERPRFMSFTYLANNVGVILSMPINGYLIDTLGWTSVFYTTGIVSLVWASLWFSLMHDDPGSHPRISNREKKYILDALREEQGYTKPKEVPWRALLTSIPVWTVGVIHAGNMFALNISVTQLPSYIASVLGYSIKENGMLSALPFLGRFLGSNALSWLNDFILNRKIIRLKTARRLFTLLGSISQALCLCLVTMAECDTSAVITILTLAGVLSGGSIAGCGTNQMDIAPAFAGTILGVNNTFAFGIAMLAPVIVGVLTPNQAMEEWQIVFLVTALVLTISSITFVCLVSTDIQAWNFASQEEYEAEIKKRKLLHQEKDKYLLQKTTRSHVDCTDKRDRESSSRDLDLLAQMPGAQRW